MIDLYDSFDNKDFYKLPTDLQAYLFNILQLEEVMLEKENLKKNFAFQFLYQIVVLVIPMILSPYLTRTLQETSLGIYSYVYSIAYYFVVVANLGISRHGQRIIAQSRDNHIKLRKAFWSLFTFHAVFSLIVMIAYFAFIVFFVKSDKTVYLIQSLFVLSALFDITWLFYGLENFKSVVIRNLIIKMFQCICIFLFIHKPSDLNVYTLITSGSILAGQVVMIPQAVKMVRPIKFEMKDILFHTKPMFVFAIAVIASTLYTTFDMTLLGLMTNKENVAFYNYSNQIISIPNTIIGVIGTVMFPKACRMAAEGNLEEQKKYINYSIIFTAIISMGSIFGLLAISDLFAIVYYGEAFAVCGNIMKALSPIVYIIGMGNIVRTQYMIPNEMDKEYIICIICNAIINLVLSTLLIPILGIYGAVIGTLSAEFFGLVYQLVLCRKFIKIADIVKMSVPFAVIGMLMYVCINMVSKVYSNSIMALVIQVLVGLAVFIVLTVVYIFKSNQELKVQLLNMLKLNK